MSRKSKKRLIKKQNRKDRRKKQRSFRKMEQINKCASSENATSSNVVTENQQHSMVKADQKASTSRHCKKQLSPNNNFKRSPWKNAGGKVNRFRKIIDDQARRLVKRTIHIMNNSQTQRIHRMTPNKCSFQQNSAIRKTKIAKCKINESSNATNLKEGEISSVITVANTARNTCKKVEYSDDDDCIVIEPTLEEITIEDIDDDDVPSTSDITTNYQSLVNSFKDRVSSTPCHNKNSSAMNNSNNDESLPFFVDVGRGHSYRSGIETINSTDTFLNYTKFSTLKESPHLKQGSVYLKESTCDEIINLEDSRTESTLKRKSGDFDDDSVIFISETNHKDFIPIVDDNVPPLKPPKKLHRNNNLFTRSETKTFSKYNENTYNPGENEELTSDKRMVLLDGSNVAFKHGLDQAFSVKGLTIAIKYFEKMGHEVKAIIPQFRMNKGKSSDPDELARLNKEGKIVQTPCKNLPGITTTSYDDRFVLQLAFELDAAIVSNDNYRDLLHENPAFKKIIENRVIGYTWCNDIFILPKDPYGKWGPSLHTILNRT